MAAFTLAIISGGMAVILCAVLACSAPLAITSASSFPSMTALQPGIKSPHLSTFGMIRLLRHCLCDLVNYGTSVGVFYWCCQSRPVTRPGTGPELAAGQVLPDYRGRNWGTGRAPGSRATTSAHFDGH